MSSVDVAVVGRGLIGSAAARHLAERGVSTALVGPSEVPDRTVGEGPFSSHGDEGRITRIAGRTPVWSQLAARSVARYHDIELRSSTAFHVQRGLVMSVPKVGEWIDNGLINGSNAHSVRADQVRDATGVNITNGHPLAYEGPPAGYINPRRLVAAQTALTEMAGGIVVDDVVKGVVRINGAFEIVGSFGSITASRVLVATGAFGRDLLEAELVLQRLPRTVLLAEVGDCAGLPSLVLADPADSRLEEIYWVPPVRYPDGRTSLKIGGNLKASPELTNDDDLIDWFRSEGDRSEAEALETSLRALLPTARIGATSTSPCVVNATPSGNPYIGWVEDGIAVAIGGNGSAAKSSDEIGRLAAGLFSADGWTDSLDAELFAPVTA